VTREEQVLLAEINRLKSVRERADPSMQRAIDARIAELEKANKAAHDLEKFA
jgi:hypothetical protein